MENEKTFSFRFLNLVAVRNLLLIVAGMPFSVWLLKMHPEVSLFVVLATALIPLSLGLVLFFTRIIRMENVRITDKFFDSKCYGKISLRSIRSLSPTWKLTQPNIVLTLKNRRKIRYASVSNETYNKDARELQQFINTLEKVHSESVAKGGNFDETEAGPNGRLSTGNEEEMSPGVRPPGASALSKSKLLAVYIPLLLVVSGLLIYYVLSQKGKVVPPELTKEAVENVIRVNEELRERAGQFISDFQRQNGPFYLFTNDTNAVLQYLPENLYYNFDENPEGYVAESDSLKVMMANPRDQKWHISIKKGDKTYMTRKGSVTNSSPTNTFIYFIILDGLDDLKNNPSENTTRYIASIPVGEDTSVLEQWTKEDPFDGYNLGLALNALVLHPKQAAFYFVARKGEGEMSSELFKNWAVAIKNLMVKKGIEDRRFVMRVIE